jgi:AAA-like domain/TIR domain
MLTSKSITRDATPARVFISYKRNQQRDEHLASQMGRALSAAGHSVFIDRQIRVGADWANAIEEELRRCDFLVLLLSDASTRSELVLNEIQFAHDRASQSDGRPRLLPVRVDFDGPLPYPISAYLNHVQYRLWRGDQDTEALLRDVSEAVSQANDSGKGGFDYADTTVRMPLVARAHISLTDSLPAPGGAMDVSDPYYVVRDADREAMRAISSVGQTVTVKGPAQIGKSSLLVRMLHSAIEMRKRVAMLDFQLLGSDALDRPEVFFERFANWIAAELDIADGVARFSDSGLAPTQACSRFMERQILSSIVGSVVLAIDKADRLFQTEFRSDFFGMLRSWHNLRASPLKQVWKKLDLILVISTDPYLLITRRHESPFNVGPVLSLNDFSFEQVRELNRRYRSRFAEQEVLRLFELLGGHPFLTRLALHAVTDGMSPDQLFAHAKDDAGPFGDHLGHYLLRLSPRSDLMDAVRTVLKNKPLKSEEDVSRLLGAGLVRREQGRVVMRCELYRSYFRERLGG